MNQKTSMHLTLGDRICWINGASENPADVKEGMITKITLMPGIDQLCWVDKQHKSEDCIMVAFVYPARVKDAYIEILKQRAILKAAYNDSMKLIYQLRNDVINGIR